jgi:hypothetical protein
MLSTVTSNAATATSTSDVPSSSPTISSELDKNIPVAADRFMAECAGAREVVEIEGASTWWASRTLRRWPT